MVHGQLLIPSMPIHVAYRSGHFAPSVCYGRQISAWGCCETVGTCDRPPAEFRNLASSAVRSGAARASCRNLHLQPRVAARKCPANVPVATYSRAHVYLARNRADGGAHRAVDGEAAVCESILRVEAGCAVIWRLLKGGKGPFLGAIRNETIDSTEATDEFGQMSSPCTSEVSVLSP